MRESSRLFYIKNVLGIRSMMIPEGYVHKLTKAVFGDTEQVELYFQTANHGKILFLSCFENDESQTLTVDEMQLLEKIIVALKLKFSNVDIAKFRKPHSKEALTEKIAEKNYGFVFLLGRDAAHAFERVGAELNSLITFEGIHFFTTYHPHDMLKTPDIKKQAWHGFQTILEKLPR